MDHIISLWIRKNSFLIHSTLLALLNLTLDLSSDKEYYSIANLIQFLGFFKGYILISN